jgi:hypothetical protein
MVRYFQALGVVAFFLFAGCSSVKGNDGNFPAYKIPEDEAEWVRNGEPLTFEEQSWLPQDRIDIFLDSEVYPVGEYRDLQIFVSKEDVRPFKRLYTKFGKNKFRVYKKAEHDKNK